MNDGTKLIKTKLNDLGINYTDTDNENIFVISLNVENTGVNLRYAVSIEKMDTDEYFIYIMTSAITAVNNELELLKLINDINLNSSFITYNLREGELIAKVQTYSYLKVITDEVLRLICLIDKDISENYTRFMKSNWA